MGVIRNVEKLSRLSVEAVGALGFRIERLGLGCRVDGLGFLGFKVSCPRSGIRLKSPHKPSTPQPKKP